MKGRTPDGRLTLEELSPIVQALFDRAQRPLLPGATGPVALFVRYLRRKPGRGLAIIYHAGEVRGGASRLRSHTPGRSVSLTVEETALEGTLVRCGADQARQTPLEALPSGVLSLGDVGVSVQAFPADAGLPSLAASCDGRQEGPVFLGLEAAARHQLGGPSWQLISASAEPVRYKPGSRCVIRYHLVLEQPGRGMPSSRSLTLFGKVYASQEQARTVYAVQQQLYREQLRDGKGLPLLPRPLGIIEALGLTLSEAIQTPEAGEPGHTARGGPVRTGTEALRPNLARGRGGTVGETPVPVEALTCAARALARLHTSALSFEGKMPRTATAEVKRLQERASLLAAYYPALAERVRRLAARLAERLGAALPDGYVPAHGGFKSSQLLIAGALVYVVDFDGCCLADPALDVGYFLAYLRPGGLWYRLPGMRQWYEQAATAFRAAYGQALRESGREQITLDGIAARSPLYEAALLFKIATRRVNRLNSPRPQEQAAILDEIAACLEAGDRAPAR